ncbi:MAG: FAD-binding protein [Rhodobacter sp.]|nr:FAD-binding protein [Rhodobacter sp.]
MQRGERTDPFGRDFTASPPLAPPHSAIRVTGALFHTQGGLAVIRHAQVLHRTATPFANLCAGGGVACGLSGPDVSGYLSGNGLLSALSPGAIAGQHAISN